MFFSLKCSPLHGLRKLYAPQNLFPPLVDETKFHRVTQAWSWGRILHPPSPSLSPRSSNSRGSHLLVISCKSHLLFFSFIFICLCNKLIPLPHPRPQGSWPQGLYLFSLFTSATQHEVGCGTVDTYLLNQYFFVKTWNNTGSPAELHLILLPLRWENHCHQFLDICI